MKKRIYNCPNCGGKIDYVKNSKVVNCTYCKSNIVLEDDPIIKKIENCLVLGNRNFFDKEYEEAYKKYDEVLKIDPNNSDAIFKRGLCISLTTTYNSFELASSLNGLKNAFNCLCNSDYSYKEIMESINRYAQELLKVIISLKKFAHDFYKHNPMNYNDINDYVDRLFACLKALEYVCYNYELSNKTKIKYDNEILKLIKEIESEKKYISFYEIESGNPIYETYSLNRKESKFLKKCYKKYQKELINISSEYKDRNNQLRRQRFILIVFELILITLIYFILFHSNKPVWGLILLLDVILIFFDILSNELIKNNIFSIVIKVFIAIVSIIGFCI